MGAEFLPLIIVLGMFGLLALGMHIGLAMALAGFVGMATIIPADSSLYLLGQTVSDTALSFDLSVIPLFVLMGFLATRLGLSGDLYAAFNAWMGGQRGGLGMATVGACGAFGAISGSSLATAATMSEVALPEMRRYEYSDTLATGVIAAGGTIGILIPPSVIMVIYGIMTETSIVDLFLAGLVPGIILVLLFFATVAILVRVRPGYGPPGRSVPFAEKIAALRKVFGSLILFLVVLGGIYMGVFTASEAAGVGAFGAVLLGLAMGRMTWKIYVDALMDTIRTTTMIFTILIGALVFKNYMALAQVPFLIESWISQTALGPTGTILLVILIYIILGAILDTIAMILLTVPVFFPLVTSMGYDPVWFGILIVVVVEMALISPPMGMNVFVIKGMAPEVSLATIYKGVMPFVAALAVLMILLLLVPGIALWLPSIAG
ncbi:TRAP transporter large permease [Cognatishimia sp. SS12]|uniref:TRAP transporter large permease n=1 Tax=Cognatishimia sp. SS12 TaxID=2979465 RepID=UPI002330D3E5|nr:TRAP transporter large permease [Cognatishimia sp. SS12]MDC0739560.1 TRAP transporter large permease [Cognatishimia sp. SS12]